jgi:phage/plasmid-associated DNA primase
LAWQREGLDAPKNITEATDDYRMSQDTFGRFVRERVLAVNILPMSSTQLRAIYKLWAMEEGVEPFGPKRFSQELENHGLTSYHGTKGTMWK